MPKSVGFILTACVMLSIHLHSNRSWLTVIETTTRGFRECHVEPDWLLIYRIDGDALELFLFRTGTHSDLF